MRNRSRIQRSLRFGALACLLGALVLLAGNLAVQHSAAGRIVGRQGEVKATTAIVLGCRVNGEEVSGCLEERLGTALELYTSGRVQRLLLSGDHGRKAYDEVNAMMEWLVERGVPRAHIFLDHAGFDTHDTMVRAYQVFQVREAVVVSQAFHLPRAVFLAQAAGLKVMGVSADPPQGSVCAGSRIREPLACLKACADVVLATSPRFLGPPVPITGDPSASHDKAQASR
jgi:SanA protein